MSPETTAQVFDTTEKFIVTIQSGGTRRVELKYPTDAQWIARTNAQKIIRMDLGRGRSKSTATPIEVHDARLFDQCKIGEPSAAFDEFEASLAIDKLTKADIIDTELVGDDQAIIRMEVFGGARVEFVMNMPRRRHAVEYGRAAVNVTATLKGAETVVSLEPSLRLFDQLLVSKAGYAENSAVPIIHKDVAIVALIGLQSPEA